MARMPDGALVSLGPWPRGANNLAREDSVPQTAYRRGVNVDTYPGGKIRRRKGRTAVDGTPASNLWSDGSFALCTTNHGTTLCRFDPATGIEELYHGLAPEADVVYESVNHLIYVSDGIRALRVDTTDAAVRPWGVPRPAAQPTLTAVDGGLAPGAYQVAVTYSAADGEESGTMDAASINLPNGGGIRAQLPALLAETHVTTINLYVTRTNGGEFGKYGSYPIGALDVVIGPQRLGRPLFTMGLDVMPAGTAATLAGGRLLIAVDNMVIGSEPMFFGLSNPAKNTVLYPAPVDMLAAAAPGAESPGTFVAAGAKTYFLNGTDFRAATNQLAYAAGAVRGKPVYVHGDAFGIQGFPSKPLPVWIAKNGQPCVGLPDGSVFALTNARYAMDSGDYAFLGQRDLAGVHHLVASVRSPIGSAARAGDSATATLVRNGVEIP